MKNVAFIGIETPIVIGILHTQHMFTFGYWKLFKWKDIFYDCFRII